MDEELTNLADDEGLGISDLQVILAKINTMIKRHNNYVFQPRINNQIINQVLKSEREKLDKVHERLRLVEAFIKPLLLSNIQGLTSERLKEFDLLITELPESKYLFVKPEAVGLSSDSESEVSSEYDQTLISDNILVEDDSEMITENTPTVADVRRSRLQLYKQINQSMQYNDDMLRQYDTCRSRLVVLNQELNYKFKKLQYLNHLKSQLQLIVDNYDLSELNKFKILVDSVQYKMNQQNKQDIVNYLKDHTT